VINVKTKEQALARFIRLLVRTQGSVAKSRACGLIFLTVQFTF